LRLTDEAANAALVELGRELRRAGYQFVTVTPDTHRLVLERDPRQGRDLRDVFGWSRSFAPTLLPEALLRLARDADVIRQDHELLRSTVRFSSLDRRLYAHSAFPTLDADAVFFGPDTYRFSAFLARSLRRCRCLVDIGCGSGAGGLGAAHLAERLVLADISPRALRFAAVNAALAGIDAELIESDVLSGVGGPVDAVIANPPYLREAASRIYRDGGGQHGEALSLRILRESLARVSPGGRVVLYTGAAVVEGRDQFRDLASELCRSAGASFEYSELDPDVFGSELAAPPYAEVERLAAVGLVAVLPDRRQSSLPSPPASGTTT
jgi:methylase of polypeptide subunit release factors